MVARPVELPGIALAALASIGLGAVIGPAAPLIALRGGLAFLAVWLEKRDLPDKAGSVVAASGSFAAISTLLGSPLAGAFLLLEASSLGGPTASVVLVSGLLGVGTATLIVIGFASLTGHGTYLMAIHLPPVRRSSCVKSLWAVVILRALQGLRRRLGGLTARV
jgi:hypothetical protein